MENYLTIDNEAIPLPSNGISVTLINPVFDSDSISRAYSFPFNLPLSPSLSNKLNHPRRLDAKPMFTYLNAKLFLEDQEFFKGKFSIYRGINNSIEGNLQSDARVLLDDAEKIKIRNLVADVLVADENVAYWSFNVGLPTPGKLYNITINTHTFGYTAAGGDVVFDVVAGLKTAIAVTYPNLITATTDRLVLNDPNNENPKVYRSPLLNLFYEGSYTAAEAAQANFLEMVKADMIAPNEKYSWNYVENTDLYGSKKPDDFENIINPCYYNSTTSEWNVPANAWYDTDGAWQYTYSPFVRMSWVLGLIKTALGLDEIKADFDEWADIENTLIDNDYVFDSVSSSLVWNTTTLDFDKKYSNVGVKNIMLKLCVPDWTAKELLSNLAETFACFMVFENNKLIFKKKKKRIETTPHDWSGIIEAPQERQFVKPQGFVLKYKTYDNDAATPAAAYTSGEGVKEITLPIGIPAQKTEFDIHFITKSKEKGDTTGLRLFFDFGDLEATVYSYRMSGVDDFGGSSFSLVLTGTNGVYKTFREGIDDIAADGWEIVKAANIKAADIFRLQNWDNAVVYFYDTEGCAVRATIKKIEIKVTYWAIEVAKVTFVKY